MRLAVAALALMAAFALPACSKPQSVESVSGYYGVDVSEMAQAAGVPMPEGVVDTSSLSLSLDADGTGMLSLHGEVADDKRLKWQLSGGSKNLSVLISLDQPISADDPIAPILLMMETDPSRTKIQGKVTDGEISIRLQDKDVEIALSKILE